MFNRRRPWIIIAFGVLLLANPLYWNLLQDLGLDLLLDLNISGAQQFYIPIGGMYLLAGLLALHFTGGERWEFRQLTLGVGASLLIIWIIILGFFGVFSQDVSGTSGLEFMLGTPPVMVALLVGASPDPTTARKMWGVAALLLLPFLGRNAVIIMDAGGGSLTSISTIIFTALIVVLDTIWAYPLYRLGRSMR